jgi:hypothetical protein
MGGGKGRIGGGRAWPGPGKAGRGGVTVAG